MSQPGGVWKFVAPRSAIAPGGVPRSSGTINARVKLKAAKAGDRVDGSDGRQAAVRMVEVHKLVNVQVGEAVSVGHHERVAVYVTLDPLHPRPGHGVDAGIGQYDFEVLLLVRAVVHNLVLLAEADHEVIVHGLVIQEVFLYHVAAITQAKHKFAEAAVRVDLHDVPQNRATADLNHRLGPELSFFAQPSAESAT